MIFFLFVILSSLVFIAVIIKVKNSWEQEQGGDAVCNCDVSENKSLIALLHDCHFILIYCFFISSVVKCTQPVKKTELVNCINWDNELQ